MASARKSHLLSSTYLQRRKIIFSVEMLRIALLVLTSMTSMISSESSENFINQPLKHLAGVYFEHLGNLIIYSDQWKFINYVNLAPLEEKEKILTFYAKEIIILCNSILTKNLTCSGLQELKHIQYKLAKLKIDRETINDIIGRSNDEIRFDKRSARVERGVFDFVGQIEKVLFGTLDSSDANYYNKQIDLAYNNSKELTNLYKKQVSIIKSTINDFSDAFEKNSQKFKEVDFNLNKLKKRISNNTRKLTKIQINTEVNSHMIECSQMVLEYEIELETLTQAVLLARRGLLHPKILTPRELFNNLKNMYDTHNKRLPIKMELGQFSNLIDSSDISIFYKDHKLVYIIEIPIIEQTNFILYRVIPLPIKQNEENVYAFINLINTHIGLSADRQLYTHLTDRDITKCKKINSAMICKQTDLLYQVSSVHNCESELLKSAKLEKVLKECDVRLLKIHHTGWYQLQSVNSWLYTAPHEETLQIVCKDNKPRQTQLFSTGIIQLSSDCNAIADNVLIRSKTVNEFSINKYFIPNINLSTNQIYENIKNSKVNISDLHLINIGKTPYLDIDSLRAASTSLDELYKKADEISKHHRTNSAYENTLSWFYILLFSIIGLVGIFIIVKLIKRACKINKPLQVS
ncbi:uncharacterized protein [Linepithema humile]|uniref:uncharacterized protein n=1 Tax=Linepithema humile TaxID=83485 RepID=UPI00351F1526